jgi:microcompartment protein CcmK/EutM
MFMARVDGSAVATVKHPSLAGWRFAICQPLDENGDDLGAPLLALDGLGAGLHQRVIITTEGRSIRERVHDPHSPARHLIIEIADD